MTPVRPNIMALTVYRPQSELMAMGLKPIENRGWPPMEWMLGRYIALHASTRWDQAFADFVQRHEYRLRAPCPRIENCPTGIIAVGRLVGWVEAAPWQAPGPPRVVKMLPGHSFGALDLPWFIDRFGWVLRDVKRIAPLPIRGKQKLWALPPPAYEAVRRRYARASPASVNDDAPQVPAEVEPGQEREGRHRRAEKQGPA